MASRQNRKPTKRWQQLLLICGSLVICLLSVETFLRLTDERDAIDLTLGSEWNKNGNSTLHVRSDNRRLVYGMRPNADVYVEKLQRRIVTNNAGFRDYDFIKPKPKDTYRIIVIGDSVTFGWNLTAEQTYPKQLENRFIATGKRIEVFNMSVGGYNVQQEVELARSRALEYEPDLLILGYVLNDNEVGADSGLAAHFQKTSCRAYGFFFRRWAQLQHNWRDKNRGENLTTESFSELEKLSKTHQIPVLIVIFPFVERNLARTFYSVHQMISEIAKSHGFMVLDLWQSFERVGFENLQVQPGDIWHPNAAGNKIAANEIFQLLQGQGDLLGLEESTAIKASE